MTLLLLLREAAFDMRIITAAQADLPHLRLPAERVTRQDRVHVVLKKLLSPPVAIVRTIVALYLDKQLCIPN